MGKGEAVDEWMNKGLGGREERGISEWMMAA